VVAGDNTMIYQLEPKDSKTYQQEMAEFSKKMQERAAKPGVQAQPLTPPEYFIKKESKLTDIKTGQQITVTAAQDIKDVKEFTAAEISVQSLLIAPAVALPAAIPAP